MSLTTDTRTKLVLGIVLAILAGTGLASYLNTRDLADARARTSESLLILDKITRILDAMRDAETGQRGFLLTGRELYLEPYLAAHNFAYDEIADLYPLLGGNTAQQRRLERLRDAVNRKMEELGRTIEVRRCDGFSTALAIVQTDEGKQAMDEIRRVAEEMKDEETQAFAARWAETTSRGHYTSSLIICGSVIAFGIAAFAAFLLTRDIARRQRLEQTLQERNAELARSNLELEQFAYIAAHDLQEPLRKIVGYTQLLAERYRGRLDSEADEFIHYAVDGATRMQGLIQDLLAYSRVGRRGKELKAVRGEEALDLALANLRSAIEESGAVVTREPLPEIKADAGQLVQLFQNLIGNAIKFHGPEAPRIHVRAERRGPDWLFTVRDNGIGIDPQFADRIFLIFQRLHSRSEYPGTGIGLAICKKIVERHGGRISVESQLGQGSIFSFSILA